MCEHKLMAILNALRQPVPQLSFTTLYTFVPVAMLPKTDSSVVSGMNSCGGGQFQQFVSPWALLSNDPTQVIIAEKQPGILASRCVLYFAAGVHVCFEGP